MVPDPSERQVSERLVACGELVESDRVGGGIDTADGGQYDALRLARGARRIENDRTVRAAARLDFAVEPLAKRGLLGERAATVRDDVGDGAEAAMVVIAQAAPLVVDDPFELRQPLGEGQKLVDLFLVLDRGKARVGMGEHKGDFVGARVGVNRHRDGPKHLRRRHRPVELGPVRAHDGHGVTALEAEAGEPCRICAHLLQYLLPGPDLPDAEILVSIRRPARVTAGISNQELGERVRARRVGRHGNSPGLQRQIPAGASALAAVHRQPFVNS